MAGTCLCSCGYDFDAAFSETGAGGDDAGVIQEAGPQEGGQDAAAKDAADAMGEADVADAASECVAQSCEELGAECGDVVDRCGNVLACGDCAPGLQCGATDANKCGEGTCTPETCDSLGAECGLVADGCGQTIECGDCTAPDTCGGAGQANKCGCSPTSCADEGAECGPVDDGCGTMLECGSCSPPLACGGGGTPNVCGCAPSTCEEAGATCGDIDDGCGGTVDCGPCPVGYRIRMYNYDCHSKQHYWGWSEMPQSDDISFDSAPGSSYSGTVDDRTIELKGEDGDASYFTYDVFFANPLDVHSLDCTTEHLGGNHTYACGERLDYLFDDGSTANIPTLSCVPDYGYHYSSTGTIVEQSCSW